MTNYRTALRSVRYKNRSDNPTVTNRIVSFVVSDGSGCESASNTINKTVTITAVNDPPVAENVLITALNNYVGTVNTGTYDFVDPDDTEGASTYKWYRSDNSSGVPASAITGATGKTYTPVTADLGKFICFEVLPVDALALAGVAVKSPFKGPIGVFSAYITGSDTACAGTTMPITLTISGGVAPFEATLHRSGSFSKGYHHFRHCEPKPDHQRKDTRYLYAHLAYRQPE